MEAEDSQTKQKINEKKTKKTAIVGWQQTEEKKKHKNQSETRRGTGFLRRQTPRFVDRVLFLRFVSSFFFCRPFRPSLTKATNLHYRQKNKNKEKKTHTKSKKNDELTNA